MPGIANNPDIENRWPSATPAKLVRACSVSAIQNEIESTEDDNNQSDTAVLSVLHDAYREQTTAVALLVVSVWTPLMSEQISRRWFSWPNILLLSPVPIATALVAFGTWRALSGTSQSGAFIGAIGLFALSYAGIAISLWPMIVHTSIFCRDARSGKAKRCSVQVGPC